MAAQDIFFRFRRRSPGGAAGAPAGLMNSEPAYNQQDGKFYVGYGDNGSGVATSIKAFAKDNFVDNVPAGGASGYVLTKDSNADGDWSWKPTGVTVYTATGDGIELSGNQFSLNYTEVAAGINLGNYALTSALTSGLALKANTASPTFTGAVTLGQDPTAALHAATKQYVDNVALATHPSVLLATTASLTLSGEQTIDGVLTASSRVLVKDQSNAAQNGIYVTSSGSWARATDMDTWAETMASTVIVTSGNTLANTTWMTTYSPGGTLGTTAINWTLLANNYLPGTGLSINGNTVAMSNMPANTLKGNNGGSSGAPVDLTTAQVRTLLAVNNVDNTSDVNKPISTATQTALNAKEPTITGGTTAQYWRGDKTFAMLDKAAVGLANVDNTADANKPVSTAQAAAIALKANLAGASFTGKVSTAASATGGAGFSIAPGAAPTTPTAGDIWATTTSLFTYLNGATKTIAFTDSAMTGNTTGSAATLTTSRTFSITGGGISASGVAFNGSGNVTLNASVDAGHITLARMANLAANSFIGNATGSSATPTALSATQAKALLAVSFTDVSGVASAAQIPGLDASKIVSGTIDPAYLPASVFQAPIVSSGGLANLTTAQQNDINTGTFVVTTDGFLYAYSGSGSKTTAASYVQVADSTPEWSAIANKPSFATVATSGSYNDLLNKPTYATVATTGAYADLTGKPTLGSMASQNAGAVAITGGTIQGVVLDGGTF